MGRDTDSANWIFFIWGNTQHLLAGPSHKEGLRILDEFIGSHGERLIGDPLKRALLQRDLWQLFDWSASPWRRTFADERAELQSRLAVIIQRLALSAKEISALPDNYARAQASKNMADFPRGLFEPEGNWLIVGAKRYDPTASEHTMDFGGRSIFLVMVRFPGGRQQAIAYLKRLRDFEPALIYSKPPGQDREVLQINLALPQFPVNTEWALMRRLCVIDEHGEIQPTSLIESIQLRRYVAVPAANMAGVVDRESMTAAQRYAEFNMDRRHGASLRAVVAGERDFQFVHFRSMGYDPFEHVGSPREDLSRSRTETLRTCSQCHQTPGILSVNSYNREHFSTPPIQFLESSTVEDESAAAVRWKHRQFDWGLLQGLWRQAPRINSRGE